jgi:hypothetical protein
VSAEYTYDYAILRVVPRVDRGEAVNVGVILSCPELQFLDARIEVDEGRLLTLDPTVDLPTVRQTLNAMLAVCRGDADAGALGEMPQRNRFYFLVGPRSTIVQPSPTHTGRTHDPKTTLEALMLKLVRTPAADSR